MIFDQEEFEIRCEWGTKGASQLAPISDIIIIVDVLSFSTATEIATNNGAIIYPYQWRDDSALEYAKSVQAELSKSRFAKDGYSLSPASLTKIPVGTKLVIPSPNGSSLTLLTGKTPTIAGCLRNCEAVAKFAQKYGSKIAVIAAGEKWEDGSLRPAFEDLIGAGAILSFLNGNFSPEAETAVAAFNYFKKDLLAHLKNCSSGKELIAKGFEFDVELAAALNISDCIPWFSENAYSNCQI
ncbi:2-phosphosulfolactate phosphatase [Chlorogloeopsis sp. ULAP02]|uniref:2-phosphosulfolactate phosphatase n=1 Tax=Chlorogloeopsis sp. ULAP02 TaxID=3107926 RepID=UPI0031369BCC